mmetsp:Transcript_19511/g.64718  ORF Transcript_19511/g.64718 Transcript_19511/m.64718 type:complete len:762 (+) Transcript_19511:65-2350(+)
MAEWIQNELRKLNLLVREGLVSDESFEQRKKYLEKHGVIPEAGVGMTITEKYPFEVILLVPGGPAERTGIIKVGDILHSIDGKQIGSNFTGDQVRAAVIGPVGTQVELKFQEGKPKRSVHGAYIARLLRAPPTDHGVTQVQASEEISRPLRGCEELRYNDDFDISSAERAIKHQYDPKKKEWARTLINVVVHPEAFAEGAMRKAYHMKDLSVVGADSRYVLKISKELNEATQIYFDDVAMQMEAKMYAEMYNAKNPPKKVDFLHAYVLQLTERAGKPICAVEKYIEGDYKKYNNNWNWSDEQRNTPQAFSHFTWEASGHTILVCDIQGVGDVWTDPQIHSSDQEGYGKGNMGKDGIEKFFESHKCNPICQWLKLPFRAGQIKAASNESTLINTRLAKNASPAAGSGQVLFREIANSRASVIDLEKSQAEELMIKAKLEMQEVARAKRELERMRQEFEAKRLLDTHSPAGADHDVPKSRDVKELEDMGFSRDLAQQAMTVNMCLSEAIEWCLASQTAAAGDDRIEHSEALQRPPARQVPQIAPSFSQTSASRGTNVEARLIKEYAEFEKENRNNLDSAVVFAEPLSLNGPDIRFWRAVIIGPPDTVYSQGAFELSLEFPESYPMSPPVVKFVSKVFHPNVWARPDGKFGEICLDILGDSWSPALRVYKILLSVVALLQSPEPSTPLDKFVGEIYLKNYPQFEEYAKKWTLDVDVFRPFDVRRLHSMGFKTGKILDALRECEHDCEMAVNKCLVSFYIYTLLG